MCTKITEILDALKSEIIKPNDGRFGYNSNFLSSLLLRSVYQIMQIYLGVPQGNVLGPVV